MALILADRVKETTTTTGTGTITLAGAATGYRSFSVIGNGNSTYYAIIDTTANTWEVGVGVYSSSGPTLSRVTVFSNSSSTTTQINFAAGTKDVICTQPAWNTLNNANTSFGYQSLNANASGTNITAIGYQSGLAFTGNNGTYIGWSAGKTQQNSSGNTAIGAGAMYNASFGGGDNNTAVGAFSLTKAYGGNITAIGYSALSNGNNCKNNVAVGDFASYNNVNAWYNTVVGSSAGYFYDTGTDNVFMGYQAGYGVSGSSSGNYNVAIGSSALKGYTSGSQNIAIGYQALQTQTSTIGNVAIGHQALASVTATGNTAVGWLAGTSTTALTTGTFNTILGYGARTSAAASIGQIVIGVNVTGQADYNVTIGDNSGKVYNAYQASATWTQTSDGRLKTNVQNDNLGLSFINRLRPVTFTWKPSNEVDPSLPYYNEENTRNTTTVIHGLIAQEVKAALDAEGVSTFNGWDQGSDGVQAISREMFISPLIKAIQELKAELDIVKAELAALKGA